MLFQTVMRPRLLTACVAAACTLVPAASASAATSPTHLRVRECNAGESAKERAATFYARMRTQKGTSQMAMRFVLLDSAGDGPAQVVDNPALAQWRRSRPGVKSFGYAQSVAGLDAGGVYSVQVQFRWLDARGRVLRREKRQSGVCRQQGELPNLALTRLAARAGETSGTELYSVDVTNLGRGPARDVSVGLFVDGAGADSHVLDLVEPGRTVTVRFTGPTCEHGLRAVTDDPDALNETNEDDNVIRARCPVLGG